MQTFKLDASAITEIGRLIRESGFRDPVVKLCERSESNKLLDDLTKNIVASGGSSEYLEEFDRGRFFKLEGQLISYIAIGVEDRSLFIPEHLKEIDGFTFLMDKETADKLSSYYLTFEVDRFFLRAADGASHSLRSIWSEH